MITKTCSMCCHRNECDGYGADAMSCEDYCKGNPKKSPEPDEDGIDEEGDDE